MKDKPTVQAEAGDPRGEALARLDYLYRRAVVMGDIRLGLAVEKQRDAILGLSDQTPPPPPPDQFAPLPPNWREIGLDNLTDRQLLEVMILLEIPLDDKYIEDAKSWGLDVSKAIREGGGPEEGPKA